MNWTPNNNKSNNAIHTMEIVITERKNKEDTFISITGESTEMIIKAMARYVDEYRSINLISLITPQHKYYYDPLTWEPIIGGKNYPKYGVLLHKIENLDSKSRQTTL